MRNRNLNLPEPTLAEHELIRDSAPVPELSAGFKARVMAECSTSIAAAQRAYRLKLAGAVATVCCLGLLLCLTVPTDSQETVPVVEQPSVPVQPTPSSNAFGLPPGSSPGLAVDSAKPVVGSDPEKSQMNEIIEDLNDRQKIFNANMLPKF